jgi:hypothetical protein
MVTGGEHDGQGRRPTHCGHPSRRMGQREAAGHDSASRCGAPAGKPCSAGAATLTLRSAHKAGGRDSRKRLNSAERSKLRLAAWRNKLRSTSEIRNAVGMASTCVRRLESSRSVNLISIEKMSACDSAAHRGSERSSLRHCSTASLKTSDVSLESRPKAAKNHGTQRVQGAGHRTALVDGQTLVALRVHRDQDDASWHRGRWRLSTPEHGHHRADAPRLGHIVGEPACPQVVRHAAVDQIPCAAAARNSRCGCAVSAG